MAKDHETTEELIHLFLSDDLDDAGQKRLAVKLSSTRENRMLLASYMRLEGILLAHENEQCLSGDALVKEKASRAAPVSLSTQRTGRSTRRKFLYAGTGALAASILGIYALLHSFATPIEAAELLDRIERVTLESVDRVYSIERLTRTATNDVLVKGRLSCRGIERFVIEFPRVTIGGDEREVWFVPERGPVRIVSDVAAICDAAAQLELGWLQSLMQDSRDGLTLSATKLVSYVRENGYTIELDPTDSRDEANLLYLLVCRHSAPRTLPQTVRIWAYRDSYELYRLEMDWGVEGRPQAADLLSFQLDSFGPISTERFDREFHHDSQRTILTTP